MKYTCGDTTITKSGNEIYLKRYSTPLLRMTVKETVPIEEAFLAFIGYDLVTFNKDAVSVTCDIDYIPMLTSYNSMFEEQVEFLEGRLASARDKHSQYLKEHTSSDDDDEWLSERVTKFYNYVKKYEYLKRYCYTDTEELVGYYRPVNVDFDLEAMFTAAKESPLELYSITLDDYRILISESVESAILPKVFHYERLYVAIAIAAIQGNPLLVRLRNALNFTCPLNSNKLMWSGVTLKALDNSIKLLNKKEAGLFQQIF